MASTGAAPERDPSGLTVGNVQVVWSEVPTWRAEARALRLEGFKSTTRTVLFLMSTATWRGRGMAIYGMPTGSC